jgi:hypothetical protein
MAYGIFYEDFATMSKKKIFIKKTGIPPPHDKGERYEAGLQTENHERGDTLSPNVSNRGRRGGCLDFSVNLFCVVVEH